VQRKENGRKKEAETQIRRSPQKKRETEFFSRFFPRRKTTTERRRRRAPLDIFESSFALCSFSTLSFGCARRGRTIGRQTYFICISLLCVIFVRGVSITRHEELLVFPRRVVGPSRELRSSRLSEPRGPLFWSECV